VKNLRKIIIHVLYNNYPCLSVLLSLLVDVPSFKKLQRKQRLEIKTLNPSSGAGYLASFSDI